MTSLRRELHSAPAFRLSLENSQDLTCGRYHAAIDLDEIPKMKRVDDLTRILSRELRSAA